MLFSFLSVKCRKLTRSLRCLPVLTLPEFANPIHPRKKTVNSEVLTAPIKVTWGVKSKMQSQNWNPGRPAPNHVPFVPLDVPKANQSVTQRGQRGPSLFNFPFPRSHRNSATHLFLFFNPFHSSANQDGKWQAWGAKGNLLPWNIYN